MNKLFQKKENIFIYSLKIGRGEKKTKSILTFNATKLEFTKSPALKNKVHPPLCLPPQLESKL